MNNFKDYLVNFVVGRSVLPEVDSFLLEAYNQVLFDDRIKTRLTHDYMKRRMSKDPKHSNGHLHGDILNHGNKKYEFHEIGTSLSDESGKNHTIIKVVSKSTGKAVLHI